MVSPSVRHFLKLAVQQNIRFLLSPLSYLSTPLAGVHWKKVTHTFQSLTHYYFVWKADDFKRCWNDYGQMKTQPTSSQSIRCDSFDFHKFKHWNGIKILAKLKYLTLFSHYFWYKNNRWLTVYGLNDPLWDGFSCVQFVVRL